MAVNPWAWQEGRNPYTATAFQVLALDVNLRGRAAIRAHINARRRRVRNAPERFPLFGRPLSEAEINEAEERILDPEGRLLAELCTHRQRSTRLEVEDLEQRLDALTNPGDRPAVNAPKVSVNRNALRALVPPPSPRTFAPLWTDHAAE
jgi:hypothetical protein